MGNRMSSSSVGTAAVTLTTMSLYFLYLFYYRRNFGAYSWTLDAPLPENFHWFLGTLERGTVPGFGSTNRGWKWILHQAQQHGNWMNWVTGLKPQLTIARPDNVQILVKGDVPKPTMYVLTKRWLGNGLLVNSGPDWKKKRRMLTPSFHFEVLKEFHLMFVKNTHILLDMWNNQIDKSSNGEITVDLQNTMSLLALDNICETAMGTSPDCLRNEQSEFLRATKEASRLVLMRFMNPIYHNEFFFGFFPVGRQFDAAVKILHDHADNAIIKRQQELKDGAPPRSKYFMDILLTTTDEEGKGLTLTEMRAETNTFMFEGHDTTASGMMWVLYDIARHPDVEAKVLAELREAFGDDSVANPHFEPSYAGLSQLKYLNMAISESLRIHPVAPSVSRGLTEPTDFYMNNGKKVTVPIGGVVQISVVGLHLQEDLWPEPTKFDPERFSDENRAGRNPYTYLPFLAGPRNCIGQNYAMLELRDVIAMVLLNFKVRIGPDVNYRPRAEMVLRNEGPLNVYLSKRQRI